MNSSETSFDMRELVQAALRLHSLPAAQHAMLMAIQVSVQRFLAGQHGVLGRPIDDRAWRNLCGVRVHATLESLPVPTVRRGDGELMTIEPDAYAQWRSKFGVEVDASDLHELLGTAAGLLFTGPIQVQPSPNGYTAEVLSAGGEPLPWHEEALVSHVVVLAALLGGTSSG